jgi:hypothetical protein
MPTGFPKDPEAHKVVMRAKNAKLLAADEARVAAGGPLVKPRKKAVAKKISTNAVAPEKDFAYIEKKNPIKRAHAKKIVPSQPGNDALIQSMIKVIDLRDKSIADLESDLKDWQDRYDKSVKKIGDLQDTGNDLRMYIFTLLEILSKGLSPYFMPNQK